MSLFGKYKEEFDKKYGVSETFVAFLPEHLKYNKVVELRKKIKVEMNSIISGSFYIPLLIQELMQLLKMMILN